MDFILLITGYCKINPNCKINASFTAPPKSPFDIDNFEPIHPP